MKVLSGRGFETAACAKGIGRVLVVCLALFGCGPVRDASAAVCQQVQSGTVANTANGTQVVTISSVDTTKSILFFQTRSDSNRPVASEVRGRLASATTIEFIRATNEGVPATVNIQWYLATFGSGVKVQRGEVITAATSNNAAITAVAALNQAFVLWSQSPDPADNIFDATDAVLGELTTTTNLQFRTAVADGTHTVSWQVVEFTNAADIKVQKGSIATMTGLTTSVTAAIAAVNVNKTFVLIGWQTTGAGPDMGSRLLRAQLTNATTITIDRAISGSPDDITEISWQAIEFKDASTVWNGSANFGVGAAVATGGLGVPEVNTLRAVAMMSSQGAGGQSMGRSPYAGDDTPGVAMATASITYNQITLTRTNTLAVADIGWSVVQFDGGTPFKVGSFTKTTGAGPLTQTIAHGLGQVPKALIVWTEGRTDETFSNASAIAFRGSSFASTPGPVGVVTNDVISTTDRTPANLTVTTPLFTTAFPNELLLAYVGAGGPVGQTVTGVAGAGLTWVLVRRTNVQAGTAEIWRAFAPAILTNVTVTATLSVAAESSILVMSYSGVDPTGANGAGAIGATGTGNANPGAPTASLTTTRNNSAVLGVGNDTATATNRTAGALQVVIHTYLAPGADTYWMQSRNAAIPASGTLVTINDTAPAGDPYNLTIVEVLPQIAGTITINVPTGTVQNDVMLASIGFQPSTATVPTPAGWTLLRRVDNAGATSNSLVTYYRVADAAEPANYTWPFTAITGAAGGIQSFSGVDITSPIDVELGQNTASSLSHAAPTVTTTMANDMIVTAHSFASSATWTSPAGMTEAYDTTSLAAPANAGQSIEGNYVLQAAVAATGAKTAVAASPGNLDVGNAQTVALRPVTQAYFGFGMSDGTTDKSLSASSQNGADISNAASRLADKLLTIVQWNTATAGVVLAEADLQSWDDTNITLNWMTNDARAYVVHYIAFGGTDLMATVVPWTMGPASGDRKVVGVPFQPNLVFHAYGSYLQSTASPVTSAGAAFGLGAMDGEPTAGHQWATSFLSADALGTTDTQRGQQIDACIYAFDQALASQRRAHFVSMNTDGFTVNFSPSGSAVDAQVISLALAGLNGQVGSFPKSTGVAPASQPVTGVGFKPSAVLLTSFQDVARTGGPVVETRFGIGASDGTTQGSSAFRDQDAAAGTSNLLAVDKTSKVFVKINNNNTAPIIIDAEANLTSLDVDGFTLNWTTNDAVQTQILYVAMAPLAVTEVRLISFDAKRYDRGVLLRWRTGYEINNLGFNLYREVNGVRAKVNRTPIAGSGLAAGRGTRVNAEQSYALWDFGVADTAGPVLYWLEDLDFRGKSTMHGPVTLMAGGRQTPSNVATSADLSDLGKPAAGGAVLLEHNGSPDTGPVRPRTNATVATQWDLAAQAPVKIGVRASGWYRVMQPDLVAAGLNPGVDPQTLQLFVDGAEQAMRVTGDTDGRFDPADAIEFYGTGVDTASTDTRIYWLRAGVQHGQRIAVTDTPGVLVLSEGITSFVSTLQRKDRSIFFAALKNGDTENWFGPLVSGDPTLLTLTPDHIDRGAPGSADLDVALQGVTTASDGNAGHQVGVLVNGIDVGEVDFDGQAHTEQTFPVPVTALIDGENTVTLIARGGVADLSLVDVIRLRYWHTYQADADRLRITTNTSGPVTISGFASAAIRVVDVTDPSAAVELHGAVQPEVGGTSSVTVVPGPGPRTLFAFSASAVASPASVRANHLSSWHLPAHAHDYVVISHANFVVQVTPLADLRQQQGHHVAVIDVDDLYDEFSYGQKTPQAVKDFLQLARTTWSEAPRFVVLAGDATMDPRDYAGLGDADFVPTKQVAMTQVALEAASDDWFVDFDGTGLPAMAIGRLPVRTAEQAAAMVAKIVGYDSTSAQPWTKDILLVADRADDTSNFERSDDHLAALLPAGYTAHRVFRGVMGDAGAHQALSDEVNAGQLIVNYVGHGSVSLWGSNGELLQNEDVAASWQNALRLPFVVSMNCLNGLFDGIYGEESLAEALLRAPNGGAVAAWASSSVTPPAGQALLNEELFRLIFQGVYPTLGEAISAAKRVVPNSDLRRSWIYFGDPAMRLIGTPQPVPLPPFPGPVVPVDTRPRPAPGGTPVGVRLPPAVSPVAPPAASPVAPPVTAPVEPPPSAAPAEPPGVVVDINALLDARGEPIRLVDFTGDGRADKMFYSADSGRWAAIGNEVGAITTRVRGMRLPVSSDLALRTLEQGVNDLRLTDPAWLVMAADLNTDRRADLVFYKRDTAEWVQALTTSDGTFAFTRGTLPMQAAGAQVRIGDFDGDHRDDLLVYDPRSGAWTMGLSDGLGGFTTRDGTGPAGLRVQVADLNGDGFADIVGYNASTGRGMIALNSLSLQFSVGAFDWGRGWRMSVAHLGGTVGADLLFYSPTTGAWLEAINDGNGRFTTSGGTWVPGLEIHAADLDGDGLDDVFAYNPTSGHWLTALNVSPGRFTVADGEWTPGWSVAMGDVNGDGRADVVLYDPVTGVWFEWLTVEPGGFASVSGNWLPGASLIGRPR